MRSVVSVSFVGCFLFLNACATHQGATTRVQVTVTGNADISEAFARDVRGATLNAISHYVPNARPLTVAVVLDGATSRVTVIPSSGIQPRSRVIASISPNPQDDGAPPTVPIQPASIAGELSMASAQLRGMYAISDADGRVIESNVLRVSSNPFNRDGELGMRRDLTMRAGEFIAFRVQALSR